MRRSVFFLFLLASFAAQATGAVAIAGESSCAETCPDDPAGGGCTPACPLCACCSFQPAATLEPPPPLPAPPSVGQDLSGPMEAAALPQPEEIFHVPRPFLA